MACGVCVGFHDCATTFWLNLGSLYYIYIQLYDLVVFTCESMAYAGQQIVLKLGDSLATHKKKNRYKSRLRVIVPRRDEEVMINSLHETLSFSLSARLLFSRVKALRLMNFVSSS